jgi:tetratricopeptide (TPR) repeat protein
MPGKEGRAGARAAGALATAALVGLAGCGPSGTEELLRQTPSLQRDVAEAVTGADSSFAGYCRSASSERLVDAIDRLERSLPLDLPAAYRAAWKVVDRPHRRICACLAREFGMDEFGRRHRAVLDLEPEAAMRALDLPARVARIADSTSLPAEERIGRIRALLDGVTDRTHPAGVAQELDRLAGLAALTGDAEGHLRAVRAAVLEAERVQWPPLAAQHLGALGVLQFAEDRPDSALASWGRAMELAMRHRLAHHSGRMRTFYGAQYRNRGRYAVALDMFREAEDLCRRFGGEPSTIRFVLGRAEMLARLGCWDLVERGIRRARILRRRFPGYGHPRRELAYDVGTGILEAWCLLGRGNPREAARRFAALERTAREENERSVAYARMLLLWSRAELESERPDEALRVAAQARSYARSVRMPDWVSLASVQCAQVRWTLGDRAGCAADLDSLDEAEVEPLADALPWLVLHDVLRIRLAAASGASGAVATTTRAAVGRLVRVAGALDAGSGAYVQTSAFRPLGDVLLEHCAGSPELAYATELALRRLRVPGRLNGGEATRGEAERLCERLDAYRRSGRADLAGAEAAEARGVLAGRGATHLLYRVGDRTTLRWTVDGRSLRLDTLRVTRRELGREVSMALASIASPAGASGDDTGRDRAALRRLGHLLLPAGLRAAPEGLLAVTPDGALDRLPFEVLSVDPRRDAPLGDLIDVVRLRPRPAGHRRMRGEGGVGVADPALSPGFRRRHPGTAPLAGGRAEVRRLAALDPTVRVLEGPAATKDALLAPWTRARVLYFASHVVQDEGTPFSSFIPLATADPNAPPEREYLEITDIRAATFPACELVVLSGCSSGAPYVDVAVEAPGLGDAFLDSGARSVIETRWPVRDADAERLMLRFLDGWAGAGRHPIEAFHQARRGIAHDAASAGDPLRWVAFTVAVGGVEDLPRRATAARPADRAAPAATRSPAASRHGGGRSFD